MLGRHELNLGLKTPDCEGHIILSFIKKDFYSVSFTKSALCLYRWIQIISHVIKAFVFHAYLLCFLILFDRFTFVKYCNFKWLPCRGSGDFPGFMYIIVNPTNLSCGLFIKHLLFNASSHCVCLSVCLHSVN